MKRLKALILAVFLVLVISVIVGCEKDEQSKTTSSIESSSSATSSTVSLSESELRQRTMKLEYLKLRGVEDKSLVKEVSIKSYGTFEDYEAVMFSGIGANAEEIYIEVSGYEFYFPSSEKLFIFDGETLTEFNQAFEEGKITLLDIEILQQQFKPID